MAATKHQLHVSQFNPTDPGEIYAGKLQQKIMSKNARVIWSSNSASNCCERDIMGSLEGSSVEVMAEVLEPPLHRHTLFQLRSFP